MKDNKKLILIFLFLLSIINSGNIRSSQIQHDTKESITERSSWKLDKYIIGPGDTLSLVIYEPERSVNKLSVLSDGTVSIPYAGRLNLNGLSINKAEQQIKAKLEKQLISPVIQLSITETRPIKISVIGEVVIPGLYTINGEKNKQSKKNIEIGSNYVPTVLDAIHSAGGITNSANIKKVSLSRRIADMQYVNYKKTYINLYDLIINGNHINNPFLFDGDIIKVERISQQNKTHNENLIILSSNLNTKYIKVNIIGEVVNPGRKELEKNTPLIQGILATGGPTNWRANKGKIKLIRVNRNGSVVSKEYSINLDADISNKSNPILQEGDTVVVTRSKLAQSSDTLNALSSPASKIVNIWTLLRIFNGD